MGILQDSVVPASGTPGIWYGGRGVTGGGWSPTSNVIDYITIATTGNATDFGNLTVARSSFSGVSNGTRGLFGGGQT